MTKEFAEFINELNKEPIEKQVSELKDVISKMVVIIERFIDNYIVELEIIHNKIISLETKEMKSKLPKITVLSTPTPPPPPQKRPIGNENIRKMIIGELKEVFNKKEHNNERI